MTDQTTEPTIGNSNLVKNYTTALTSAMIELQYWQNENSKDPTDITEQEIQKWTEEINKYRGLLKEISKVIPKSAGNLIKEILSTFDDIIGILKLIFSKL